MEVMHLGLPVCPPFQVSSLKRILHPSSTMPNSGGTTNEWSIRRVVAEEGFAGCGAWCLGRGYRRLPSCAGADQERGSEGKRLQTDNESGREEEALPAG